MALAQVPCAYDWNVHSYYRRVDGYIGWRSVYWDQALWKRLKWIGICAAIANFRLHHFDYIKGNVSRYFVEVFSIFVPKRYPWGWAMDSKDLPKPSCYYLGTYPNYWNRTNKKIVYAHDLMTSDTFPMANDPLILRFTDKPISPEQLLEMLTRGESQEEYISSDEKKEWTSLEDQFGKGNLINYLFPEQMDKEAREAFMTGVPYSPYQVIDKAITDMAFFKKKADIIEWLRQKYILDARKLRYLRCIKVKYPKTEEPQYKIETPQLPADWPGIPTSEMELPPPTERVQKPKGLERLITLRIIFNIIHIGPNNGYYLVLYIGEEVVK